ncbi:MAG: XRE family transcriptional regulator, partial [Mycobacteriales bacterium]
VTPDNEPPSLAYYNASCHDYQAGLSLMDLAMLGRDPGEATGRLTAASAGHPEGYNRARAIGLTKLASLTMVTGDPLQAAAIGHAAVDISGTIRSRRAAEELRELFHYAAAHQHLDEVSHLRHRIATLVGRTGGYR